METRIFHGQITPQEFVHALMAEFDHGDYRAQTIGDSDKIAVQIATRERPAAGGETAITVALQRIDDGVSVQLGRQTWLGVAASLGMTAISALRNPLNLLSRLDDLAQDIENLQLDDQVWRVIENTARAAHASFELSERLRRVVCAYCAAANPIGEANCVACGAPLGSAQPRTCTHCGFVVKGTESVCPNCGQGLPVA